MTMNKDQEWLNGPFEAESFQTYFITLMSIGLLFTAWFFTLQFQKQSEKSLIKEIIVSAIAASFTGFGFLFLLLWAGIYV